MLQPGDGVYRSESVHLTKLVDRAPARFERYFTDLLEELQEEMGEGIAVETRNAKILIEEAIRSGYRTRDEIRKRTGLDNLIVSTALAVMQEYKRILPKIQEGKTEVARGQRKEFFVMNDETLGEFAVNDIELQETISNNVSAKQQKASALIEKAIRSGFQSREQIKIHTSLDTITMNAALTGMLKAKNISSKVEFVRGQRKEFFVINEQASREELPVENFSRFEDESVDFPVMQLSHLH